MPYTGKKKHEYDRKRYAENIRFLRQYKVERGCADCGWNEHHAGLQFDHLHEKISNISAIASRNREGLCKELAKCEVVCSRCHSIRTWNRQQQVGNGKPIDPSPKEKKNEG